MQRLAQCLRFAYINPHGSTVLPATGGDEMNCTLSCEQLAAELGAYSMTIDQQYAIARDSLPNTPEMRAWRQELNRAASRLCGKWLYENASRLADTDREAFFAFYGGEEEADKMARTNPAGFLHHAMKTALAVVVGSPD